LDALRHKKTYEQKFETQACVARKVKVQVLHCCEIPPNDSSIECPTRRRPLSDKIASGKVSPMKVAATVWMIGSLSLCTVFAQSSADDKARSSETARLEALAKKIDEQNAKIDALSQEILRLEQQLSHVRPGVMIGEGAPASANPSVSAGAASHSTAAGNTHTVARGETLTSIAKMYKVTVDELQQANHIEDGRKLQAGQTIVIPTPSPGSSASASP
jgi:LysM repeat protein